MIRKINLILTVLLFFSVSGTSEAAQNFVVVAGGASSGSGTLAKTSAFTGQSSLVSGTESRTKDLVLQSGFPSVITKAPNTNITFVNLTGTQTFPTQTVTVQIQINCASGFDINKVRYAIAEGQNAEFGEQIDYTVTPSTAVIFSKEINFSKGQSVNRVYLYAQDADPANVFGNETQIVVNTAGSLGAVSFISPDKITQVTSLNPRIHTTMFSLGVSSATVKLYNGTSATGVPIYDVQVTTAIVNSAGEIYYQNSQLMPGGINLTPNADYTLVVDFDNTYDDIDITFKALEGGVASILTYPSPFNPNNNEKIKIRYLLSQNGQVTINLYNKAGKIVKKLITSASRTAGTNEEEWDGRNYAGEILATGPYICEIITRGADGEARRYTALAIVGK